METQDPIELARLQATNNGLNLVIAEKEKRIEDLTRKLIGLIFSLIISKMYRLSRWKHQLQKGNLSYQG